jgi:hypothetical protein
MKLTPIESIDNVVFLASKDVALTFTGLKTRPPAMNPPYERKPWVTPDWLKDVSTEELFGFWKPAKK